MSDYSGAEGELPWTGERVVPGISETEALYQFHWARYSFAVALVDGGRVLDLGCGAGYGTHLLADSDPGAHVYGMDIAPEAVAYAANHYQLSNLRYVRGNALCPPFQEGSFDVIVSFEVLEHVDEARCLLQSAKRLLKQGGSLVVSTPNREVYSKGCTQPWNPYHVREYSLAEFRAMLGDYFPCVHVYGQSHTVGSLIWQDDLLADVSLRRDMVADQPMSEATFLIAVCSAAELPSQPLLSSQLWLMEVQDLQRSLKVRERYLNKLIAQVSYLSKEVARSDTMVQDLLAYQNRVESHWIVRSYRSLQQSYEGLIGQGSVRRKS